MSPGSKDKVKMIFPSSDVLSISNQLKHLIHFCLCW